MTRKSKIAAILAALKQGQPEGEPAPAGKYAHALAWYAKQYGKSLSTIKRWAAEGKPLDHPELIEEMKSPRGRTPEETQKIEANAAAAEPAAEDGSPVKLDDSFFTGSGILAAIERLERAERERAGAYLRSITKGAATAIVQNRFKEWIGIVDALRKLAIDAPEIRKANALTVDVAEMETAIGAVFANFRAAARNLPTRAAAKLLAVRTRDETLAILEGEIEILLRTLTAITVQTQQIAPPDAPIQEPIPEVAEVPKKKPKKKRR